MKRKRNLKAETRRAPRSDSRPTAPVRVKDGDVAEINVEEAWFDLGLVGSPSVSGPAQPSIQKLINDTRSKILGARWNPQDPPERLRALLDRAFVAQKKDGTVQYVASRIPPTTGANGQPLTGDQALLTDLANTSLPRILALLRGLQPTNPAAFDAVEGEATRSILATELSELVAELNRVPPRAPKVDAILASIRKQVTRLARQFGLARYPITVAQAENRTDYDKLKLLIDQLENATQTLFLKAPVRPEDFGTQLILLMRVLPAVTDAVQECQVALASAQISPVDEQNTYLGRPGAKGVTVADVLDWAASLEAYARALIDGAGRRGIQVLLPTVETLKGLVDRIVTDPNELGRQDPGFRRPRIQRAFGELQAALADVLGLLRDLTKRREEREDHEKWEDEDWDEAEERKEPRVEAREEAEEEDEEEEEELESEAGVLTGVGVLGPTSAKRSRRRAGRTRRQSMSERS